MMKGYKGYNQGLICRDKQYKENTVFEEERADICERGMHFCVSPFDVLDYYGLVNDDGSFNEYTEVETLADSSTDEEKKYCTTKLKIGAKLGLPEFIKACVDFVVEKTTFEVSDTNSDDKSIISSKSNYTKIGSSGDTAQIGSSGNRAQIGSSGDFAQIGSSGYYAKIGSSGDFAKIGSSGNSAQIGSSGDFTQIGSSGDSAKIESTGEDTVIMCAGYRSIAKAKKGSWITLAEWVRDESKERYVPKCVRTEFVDGDNIKEDTFYMLKDGNFVIYEE